MPLDGSFRIDFTDTDFNDPKAVRILAQHLVLLLPAWLLSFFLFW